MNRYLLLVFCSLSLTLESAQVRATSLAIEESQRPDAAPSGVCALCPEMVRLPGGEFIMGSDDADPDAVLNEKPRRKIRIKPFSLGKYEVTKGEFAEFVRNTGYQSASCFVSIGSGWTEKAAASWHDPGFSQDDDHPVVCVSYDDVQAYVRWLNLETGLKYRLPTEAEWEYAARAGSTTIRYWGNSTLSACEHANVGDQTTRKTFPNWTVHACTDGYIYTAPVGRFASNAFRLYDMQGNVWEWTCSLFTSGGYDGNENTCLSAVRARHTVRGGAWSTDPQDVRAAYRSGDDPGNRFYNLGFRLALD